MQRYYRGHRARKQFQIQPLAPAKKEHYQALLLGNDPKIELKEQDNKGTVAIIGTSGVRSVLLACELGDKSNKKIIPKIILVDNSREVHALWTRLKHFIAQYDTENKFTSNLPLFLEKNRYLFRDFPSKIMPFFIDLFKTHG